MMRDKILGSLLGEALGDSIGLWCEGMSPRRQQRFGPYRQRFFFGKGMCSDDTEHALMTAQALIVSAGQPERFVRSLAWRLRGWLLGVPAGIGLATLRSILKLWLGYPPSRSGVWSAGNGPAMRAGILGVAYGNEPDRLRELVRRSTNVTHVDPKAEAGALAVAFAAHVAATAENVGELPARLRALVSAHLDPRAAELIDLIDRAIRSAASLEDTDGFARSLGLERGVTGYMYHTVPIVLQAWLRHPRDFRAAIMGVIACGGDTDTTCAITGSIVGAGVGRAGLPEDWLANLWEWPCGAAWIERVAARLAESVEHHQPLAAVPTNVPLLVLRNGLFACIVLTHGFRRLLPPYG
jgi:ADP-ribosyl-[dinitrogen reductase] hydrolase